MTAREIVWNLLTEVNERGVLSHGTHAADGTAGFQNQNKNPQPA